MFFSVAKGKKIAYIWQSVGTLCSQCAVVFIHHLCKFSQQQTKYRAVKTLNHGIEGAKKQKNVFLSKVTVIEL